MAFANAFARSSESDEFSRLVPMDMECILRSVRKTGRLVVVHEAVRRGGIGGDIVSNIAEEAFYDLEAPVRRIAGKNTTIPFNINLEKLCIPSVEEITAGVREVYAG